MPCLETAWVAFDGETIWHVEAEGDDCIEVRRLQYGVVPAGFVETVPQRPLTADAAYSFGATGWTTPSVPFQAYGRSTFRDGRWIKLPTNE